VAARNLEVLACPPEARAEALEVLYHRLPRSLRAGLVDGLLNDDRDGLVDLSGLWIARRPGWVLGTDAIVGTLMTQALGGRAVAVWAPEVRPSWGRAASAARLIHEALDAYKARGFAIAQAVLDETVGPRGGADLARGGMPWVTDLLYLWRDTTPLIVAESDRRLEWRGLGEVDEDLFRATVRATYEGSLDMPELEGARSLDDALDGHRGNGRFAPELWRLGRVPDHPDEAAVLLLSAAAADRDAWEVVYLGLTPAARGRGLGARAIAHALELARPHADALELAVDVRNRPALRLYAAACFVPLDRRAVHLAVLAKASATNEG
jgi:ribosomal protein S18 acetylase RimI-like enzyme